MTKTTLALYRQACKTLGLLACTICMLVCSQAQASCMDQKRLLGVNLSGGELFAKESGAVEYDTAGLIVLSLSDELEDGERIATATLAKARYGQEMHIDMRFHGRRGSWRDLGRVVPVCLALTTPAVFSAPRPTAPQ